MNFLTRTGHGWLQLATSRPYAVLLGCALFTLLGLSGISQFKLDASTDALLLENDPALRQYREAVQSYGFGDFLIVTMEDSRGIFRPEAIANLRALVADLKQIEGVATVLSLLDAVVLPEGQLPLNQIIDALRQVSDEGVDLSLAQRQLTSSRVFRELLIDKDGQLTAIQINLKPTGPEYSNLLQERYEIRDRMAAGTSGDGDAARIDAINARIGILNEQALARQQKLVADMRTTLMRHEKSPTVLHLGGPAMIVVDMVDSIREDLVVFGIVAALLFLTVLSIFFRRIIWVMLPVATSLIVVLFMSGLLGWMDWKVTVISSNFAALLMILAVSLGVHIVVRHRELCGRMPNASSGELAFETCRQMFIPCLYAALTTLIAFLSLIISGIKPVIEFGKMMGVGMCVALLLSFTLMPAALAIAGAPGKLPERDWTRAVTDALSFCVRKLGPWVLLTAAVLAVLAVLGIRRLEVDNRFIDYFKEDTEIYQGMLGIDTRLGGTVPFDVVLHAPAQTVQPETAQETAEEDDWGELDFLEFEEEQTDTGGFWYNQYGLAKLAKVHRALESQQGVGKVLSLASMLELAEQMKGGEPLSNLELAVMREYVPEDIAEALFDPYLSSDGNKVRLQARVVESTPNLKRNELLSQLHARIRALGFAESEYEIVGAAVLYNNMLQSLYTSQIQTLGLVFLVVGLMFLLLFRSLTIALLGLAPNLLAAGVVLGTLGLLGIPLDLVTVTVASISVGIAVDNAIHYLYRYRMEQKRLGDSQQAVIASHNTVGQGIYYTSFSIMAGFLVFVLSNFNPTVYFGIFTALAMLMALLGSLTLLPRLLITVRAFGKDK